MWAYLRRFGAFPREARAFLGGALLVELGHAFLWTLQNLYVRAAGHGEAGAGAVLAMNTIGIVLATFPAAWMYDRFGPRRCLAVACAGAALGTVGLALSTHLHALQAFAVLNGAAFCVHWVVTAPFVMSVSTPADRSHLFGAEFATHTTAQTIGPLLAGGVAAALLPAWSDVQALRASLLLGAGLGALGVAFYLRLGDSGDGGRALVTKRHLLAILRRDRWGLWIRLAVPNFVIGLGAGITIPFINLYLTDRFGLDTDALGLVMAAAAATMTVSVIAIPAVIARLGMVTATFSSQLLSIPFFVVLAWTTDVRLAVVAVVLRQALMNLCHPIWRNFIMEITPVEWRASVNSITMLSWNLGWGASVVFGGVLIEHTAGLLGADVDGYALPMLLTIGIYLAAITTEAAFFWDRRELGRLRAPAVPSAPHETQAN